MADVILQAEVVQDSGNFKHLTACETPQGRALLVCIAGAGPIPGVIMASWKGSGLLVGSNGNAPVIGYVADLAGGISTDPIQYVRGAASATVRLSMDVTFNSFTLAATVFEVLRNGVVTIATFTYLAGATGIQQNTFAVPFVDGDFFDLRVTNPGNANDEFKEIAFSYSIDFIL